MTRDATENEMSFLDMSLVCKRTFLAYDDVTNTLLSSSLDLRWRRSWENWLREMFEIRWKIDCARCLKWDEILTARDIWNEMRDWLREMFEMRWDIDCARCLKWDEKLTARNVWNKIRDWLREIFEIKWEIDCARYLKWDEKLKMFWLIARC
jgi:hypothetical protein